MECFGVPELKTDWSIQIKNQGLISNTGFYLRGAKVKSPGARGDYDHKGCWESHIRNLHLLVNLQVTV